MRDLRSELRAYTTEDEPPIRLKFDEILVAAQRRRRRQRGFAISGVAAAAAIVIAVPTTLTLSSAPSPPSPATFATGASSATSSPTTATSFPGTSGKAPQPIGGCPAQPTEERLKCVLPNLVQGELLPGAALGDVQIRARQRSDGMEYNLDLPVSSPNGKVHADVYANDGGPMTCRNFGPEFCEERTGPHSEKILVIKAPGATSEPDGMGLFVNVFKNGARIEIYTLQESTTTRLLSTDALIRIGTTSELFP